MILDEMVVISLEALEESHDSNVRFCLTESTYAAKTSGVYHDDMAEAAKLLCQGYKVRKRFDSGRRALAVFAAVGVILPFSTSWDRALCTVVSPKILIISGISC
ncbi:hypothetical protein [Marinobacter flavimaris]|uniref:hypothetical protein n=1 Tax=Marinobacter flavimaris TaxID=262076 RepID=UPI0011B01F43|nr:hypothetical protein [Marinobacter flavimaris]